MNPYDLMQVALAVQQMRENSEKWHSADEEERYTLAINNKALAQSIKAQYGVPAVYDPESGTWHVGTKDGPLLFDLY